MPTLLKCAGCGAVLQKFSEIPYNEIFDARHPQPRYYQKIYGRLKGKCPECGRQLPNPSDYSKAMQVEVKANPAALNKSPLVAAFHHDYQAKQTRNRILEPNLTVERRRSSA